MPSDQLPYEELMQRLLEAEQREKEAEQREKEAKQRQQELESALNAEREKTRRLTFTEALDQWHQLFSSPRIRYYEGSEKIITTRGTNPTKRLYPKYLR